jgi:hypothetical protein
VIAPRRREQSRVTPNPGGVTRSAQSAAGLTFTSDGPDEDVVGPERLAGRGKEGRMTNEAGGPWEEEVQVKPVVATELDAAIAAVAAAGTATGLPRAELLEGIRHLLPC